MKDREEPLAHNNRKPQSSAIFLKVHAHKYRLMQMLMLLFNGELFRLAIKEFLSSAECSVSILFTLPARIVNNYTIQHIPR